MANRSFIMSSNAIKGRPVAIVGAGTQGRRLAYMVSNRTLKDAHENPRGEAYD